MWITALLLGFAGSMHCIGMCSPLAMAVASGRPRVVLNRAIYNAGRILVYAMAGAMVAGAGMMLPFHNYQNIISMMLGVALLLIGCTGIKTVRIPGVTGAAQAVASLVKRIFSDYMKTKTALRLFLLGALNGMLPCGLTFIALTSCLTLRGPVDGFNFMLLFGAGTLPVMLGFTSFLPTLVKKFNWSLPKVTTSMLIVSGIVLIARVFIIHIPHGTTTHSSLVDIMLCN